MSQAPRVASSFAPWWHAPSVRMLPQHDRIVCRNRITRAAICCVAARLLGGHRMPAPAFASPHAQALFERLSTRTARVGVIGLGYVGLPLAVEFGQAGFHVVGIDLDKHKCDAINAGTSYIADVPSSAVASLVEADRLRAVPGLDAADSLDTINICVPTPLRKTRDPDMTYVLSAAHLVKEYLRPGMLVVLESTTYPGTTEEIVRNILEETGLRAGFDFFLAYSPERVDPGNVKWNTKNVPKVVGASHLIARRWPLSCTGLPLIV